MAREAEAEVTALAMMALTIAAEASMAWAVVA